MLTRRKILTAGAGLICSPAIIRPAGAWQSFMANGSPASSGGIIGEPAARSFMGQVKPNGIPRINWKHPLARGLRFYGFDLGNGRYINLCSGNDINYGNLQLQASSSQYGSATLWPGLTLQGGFNLPGQGVYASIAPDFGPDNIPLLSDLLSKGTSAGNTFACGCLRLNGAVGALFQWIFGRPGISAGEGSIPVTWAFVEGMQSNGHADYTVDCMVLNGPTPGEFDVIVGTTTITPGQYTSYLCSNVNTAPGSAVCSFYAQGNFVSSASGVGMWSYNPGSTTETEIMFGGAIHTDTTEFICAFGGFVYYGAFWKRNLSAQEAKQLHLNPYCMLMG